MRIGIKAIEYEVPKNVLSNQELAELYGDWSAEKIFNKTGIESRHIADENEVASDLAERAAIKLFDTGIVKPEEIDFILLATQSPDYLLPTTACLLQSRLGIPQTAGALDFNLGCSAYIYGLALAKGLILAGIAKNILFLTAETYSKYVHPLDKSTRTIFGDAAAATIVCADAPYVLGEFDLGTNGAGGDTLIVPVGGAKQRTSTLPPNEPQKAKSELNLHMAGSEVFEFTIRVVPESVKKVLLKNDLRLDDVDLFVFHQANKFMLDFLRKKSKIPKDKFYINMADIGNTVSPTIPIALKRAQEEKRLLPGHKVLLSGFGVGLSWGSIILR